jgi:Prokaryotic Cytochrome C oxidase subunit IV
MSASNEPAAAAPVSVRRAVAVWVVLMVATALSWWLGVAHGAGGLGGPLILTVTFGKIFLVGDHFMELRSAARALRLVFAGWCVVTWAILTVQYLGT